jgi:hypothetical protein
MRAKSMLTALAAVLIVILATPGVAIATGSTVTSSPAPAAVSTAAPLTLVSQSSWVATGQNFDLEIRPGSDSTPTSDLGVSLTVYSCLSSISGFDQSITSASAPQGTKVASTSAPLPLSGLTPMADGGFGLSVPVSVGSHAVAGANGFAIALPAGASCLAGVYPVRVQLVNTTSGQVVGAIVTHLIYTSTTSTTTQKLQVALDLPIQTTISPAADPSPKELIDHPGVALEEPSATAISTVTGTVAAIAAHPIPLTLMISPQTVLALNAAAHQSVSELAALATSSAQQVISSPYTPIDATGLVDAGLNSELSLQVARGSQVLSTYLTHANTDPNSQAPSRLGTWVFTEETDATTLSELQSDGYGQVVLPASALTSAPANGSTTTPFPLATSHGTALPAMAASSELSSRFVGSARNPVLAAHQLVAEMAQMYYEKPNDDTARGVVVLPPASWSDNASFVKALVEALGNDNPIIQPVTTSTLFSALPTSATCRSGCKLVAGSATSALPVTAIRDERQRINGFATAAPAGLPLATQLGDLVLAGEASTLRPSQQSSMLRNTRTALDAQLGQLAVAGDQTITLTSLQGTLPVTIVSSAAYPVTASITVTSDKLLFANGTTTWTRPGTVLVQPGRHANIYNIPVKARTSGVFKVGIILRSPDGTLVLSSGEANVRSTATSVVGIVLSLGALLVLAVWWIRTSLRRRDLKRAHALERDAAARGEL